MHHRAAGDLDVHCAARATVDADDRVLHTVAVAERVGHRVQFPGVGVTFGMRGVAAAQGGVEVTGADGVQVVGELVVGHPALDQRQRAAGVAEHVGVGTQQLKSGPDGGPAPGGLAEYPGHCGRADPAIPVPLRLAVSQPHPVDHAVAGEPVIDRRVDLGDRVRSVAEVTPVEVGWDGPGDRQLGDGLFLRHRSVVALKVVVTHRRGLPACVDRFVTLLY
jgi:hypothetical protein